ncbi:MAG: CoA transferase [Alphaproteobacteria bacterium]|nr:CoA transferase [Alphaproteobacteria bacterium]
MKPLAGLVVLDFSRVLAAPLATMIFAELGATVIKIERPGSGDETRQWEPTIGKESGYFFAFNRAKHSVTLNLKSAKAQAIARQLAAKADIVVENFPPGTMAEMGLGYEDIKAVNPRAIYIANTGFGQNGPYAQRKGYDTIFQAMSGLMSLTGEPDRGPAKAGLPMSDLTSGLWIAVAALSGLAGRAQSGHGCFIDLSMFDAQVAQLTIAAARFFALGEVPPRTGTEHPGRVPSAAFQCRDGRWLHITGSDQHWEPLLKALGLDSLLEDEALKKNAARVERRDEVMGALSYAISRLDRAPLLEALERADVPAGPVHALDEVLADPHTRARGLVGSFEHPSVGKFPALRLPLRYEGYDNPEIGRPPLLGEHTEAVLRDMLGLTQDEIAALRSEKAV